MRDRLVGLGVAPGKVSVIANSPSLARFDAAAHERRPFAADGALRLVYTGALTPTYELDVAIDALARVRERGRTSTSASTSTVAATRRTASRPWPTSSASASA